MIYKNEKQMKKFFQQTFLEEEWRRPKFDEVHFKLLGENDNTLLIALFDDEEIKQAVWDCDGDKSPGRDKYNFSFIKKVLAYSKCGFH